MQTEIQRILELQSHWSPQNTAPMRERGLIIRDTLPAEIRQDGDRLSHLIGSSDLLIEGRDGTGVKSRIPWVRLSSQERSPKARDGFYVVYLWAFDGSAAYLSLNQGTTDFKSGSFVRKAEYVLGTRVTWARAALKDWIAARHELVDLRLSDIGEGSLGTGYELGNIAAVRYPIGAVPSDSTLREDLESFVGALGALYRENAQKPIPFENPEVILAELSADAAAGKNGEGRSVGFRVNAEERKLVEQHAMSVAQAYYEREGWIVKTKGAPFDLDLRRGNEAITVEVKGTTSSGDAVVLTSGEVEYQRRAHPANALVVVRDIVLDRKTNPPTVSGGFLVEHRPWRISEGDLRVISYQYTVPRMPDRDT